MRVLVAGATGAIGRVMVPLLVEQRHQVLGTVHRPEGAEALRRQGAEPVALDVFDRAQTLDVLSRVRPDVVVHQLTALSNGSSADNARMRTVGTRILVDAAVATNVKRLVAQSIAWAYEAGAEPADETTPLDRSAPEPRATTIAGVAALEDAVRELRQHVILRYGVLYGSGTWYAPGASVDAKLQRRELAADDGVTSFVHVNDAAQAAVQALLWAPGVYNVVDGDPAPAKQWVPVLAEVLGAPEPPRRDGRSAWERGASNRKALVAGWRCTHGSWREGFATLRR